MVKHEQTTVHELLTNSVIALRKMDYDDTINSILEDMLPLERDGRHDYLAEHGYDTADVRDLDRMKALWLNGEARTSPERLARNAVIAGAGPEDLLRNWLDKPAAERLSTLLSEGCIPEPKIALAACYVVCEAIDAANASYYLASISHGKTSRPPASATLNGDAEWADEDQRIADSGLADDVSWWPRY